VSLKSFPLARSCGISGGLFCVSYIIWSNTNKAKCDFQIDHMVDDSDDQKPINNSKQKTNAKEDFDYGRLWFFLKPDTIYLIVAVTVRLDFTNHSNIS